MMVRETWMEMDTGMMVVVVELATLVVEPFSLVVELLVFAVVEAVVKVVGGGDGEGGVELTLEVRLLGGRKWEGDGDDIKNSKNGGGAL